MDGIPCVSSRHYIPKINLLTSAYRFDVMGDFW